MSVDLHVYSARPEGLSQDKLSLKLSKKGWHVLFVDPSGSKESKAGLLRDHVVFGVKILWRLEEIRARIRSRRRRQVDRIEENLSCAVCELTTVSPCDPMELDESLPRKLLKPLEMAKVSYTLRTPAGRSVLSMQLQTVLWESIGELTGGVLEDPQEGSYFTVGAKGKKTLSKSDDSPIDVVGVYFKAAKANGFPVEMNNDEIFFHPETLSESGLEQFLRFTKNHRWPDPEYASGMVGMILDEYKFKKGAAFAKAKARWLVELEKTYGL